MTRAKKILSALFCALGLLVSGVSGAAEYGSGDIEVRVRAAKRGDQVRIVFTAEGFALAKSSTTLNADRTISVDFRKDIAQSEKNKRTLRVYSGKDVLKEGVSAEIFKSVKLTHKGMIFTITAPNVKDIKVSRLESPSRLVVDIYFSEALREDGHSSAAMKTLADQIVLRSFVIDAGHGGYEYGIRGSRFSEKDFALSFARDLASVLSKSGKDVTLVRKADVFTPISERAQISNRKGPDFFISIHVSSSKTASVYALPEKAPEGGKNIGRHKIEASLKVADAIVKNIEKEFSVEARKVELPLPLIVMTKSPAVLVELPNPDEFSYDKKNRERMLSAILRGLSAGTRDERQTSPVKRDSDSDKKSIVKPSSVSAKKDSGNGVKKADKTADIKPEGRLKARPSENPEGEE